MASTAGAGKRPHTSAAGGDASRDNNVQAEAQAIVDGAVTSLGRSSSTGDLRDSDAAAPAFHTSSAPLLPAAGGKLPAVHHASVPPRAPPPAHTVVLTRGAAGVAPQGSRIQTGPSSHAGATSSPYTGAPYAVGEGGGRRYSVTRGLHNNQLAESDSALAHAIGHRQGGGGDKASIASSVETLPLPAAIDMESLQRTAFTAIAARETALSRFQSLCDTYAAASTAASLASRMPKQRAAVKVMVDGVLLQVRECVPPLREATLACVEAISAWQQGLLRIASVDAIAAALLSPPFVWRGSNYIANLTHDVQTLASSVGLDLHAAAGVNIADNPLLIPADVITASRDGMEGEEAVGEVGDVDADMRQYRDRLYAAHTVCAHAPVHVDTDDTYTAALTSVLNAAAFRVQRALRTLPPAVVSALGTPASTMTTAARGRTGNGATGKEGFKSASTSPRGSPRGGALGTARAQQRLQPIRSRSVAVQTDTVKAPAPAAPILPPVVASSAPASVPAAPSPVPAPTVAAPAPVPAAAATPAAEDKDAAAAAMKPRAPAKPNAAPTLSKGSSGRNVKGAAAVTPAVASVPVKLKPKLMVATPAHAQVSVLAIPPAPVEAPPPVPPVPVVVPAATSVAPTPAPVSLTPRNAEAPASTPRSARSSPLTLEAPWAHAAAPAAGPPTPRTRAATRIQAHVRGHITRAHHAHASHHSTGAHVNADDANVAPALDTVPEERSVVDGGENEDASPMGSGVQQHAQERVAEQQTAGSEKMNEAEEEAKALEPGVVAPVVEATPEAVAGVDAEDAEAAAEPQAVPQVPAAFEVAVSAVDVPAAAEVDSQAPKVEAAHEDADLPSLPASAPVDEVKSSGVSDAGSASDDDSVTSESLESAAAHIQRLYRGHRARMGVEAGKRLQALLTQCATLGATLTTERIHSVCTFTSTLARALDAQRGPDVTAPVASHMCPRVSPDVLTHTRPLVHMLQCALTFAMDVTDDDTLRKTAPEVHSRICEAVKAATHALSGDAVGPSDPDAHALASTAALMDMHAITRMADYKDGAWLSARIRNLTESVCLHTGAYVCAPRTLALAHTCVGDCSVLTSPLLSMSGPGGANSRTSSPIRMGTNNGTRAFRAVSSPKLVDGAITVSDASARASSIDSMSSEMEEMFAKLCSNGETFGEKTMDGWWPSAATCAASTISHVAIQRVCMSLLAWMGALVRVCELSRLWHTPRALARARTRACEAFVSSHEDTLAALQHGIANSGSQTARVKKRSRRVSDGFIPAPGTAVSAVVASRDVTPLGSVCIFATDVPLATAQACVDMLASALVSDCTVVPTLTQPQTQPASPTSSNASHSQSTRLLRMPSVGASLGEAAADDGTPQSHRIADRQVVLCERAYMCGHLVCIRVADDAQIGTLVKRLKSCVSHTHAGQPTRVCVITCADVAAAAPAWMASDARMTVLRLRVPLLNLTPAGMNARTRMHALTYIVRSITEAPVRNARANSFGHMLRGDGPLTLRDVISVPAAVSAVMSEHLNATSHLRAPTPCLLSLALPLARWRAAMTHTPAASDAPDITLVMRGEASAASTRFCDVLLVRALAHADVDIASYSSVSLPSSVTYVSDMQDILMRIYSTLAAAGEDDEAAAAIACEAAVSAICVPECSCVYVSGDAMADGGAGGEGTHLHVQMRNEVHTLHAGGNAGRIIAMTAPLTLSYV